MQERHDRLVAHLREGAGEHLRSVIHYDEGGYDLLFVREDVSALSTDEAVEAVVHELGVETFEKRIEEKLYSHGDLEFTVLAFERGLEIYFHTGDRAGVAVGLDREALGEPASGRDLCSGVADFEA